MEAADDLLAFLARRFALTKWQRIEIASLPSSDAEAVAAALREAAMTGRVVETNVPWEKPANIADPSRVVTRVTPEFEGGILRLVLSHDTAP
jgi:hypothetical protein